tara:strand:+ start:71 stop:538 length:468 start_codon:yes stop_codon:yes gene_type:complete
MSTKTRRRGFPLDVRPYLTTIISWGSDNTYKIIVDEIWTGQGYGSPIAVGGFSQVANKNELTLTTAEPRIPSKWLKGPNNNDTGVAPLQSFSPGTSSWASSGTPDSLSAVYTPFFFNHEESDVSSLRLFSMVEWQSDGTPSSAIEFRLYTDLIVE